MTVIKASENHGGKAVEIVTFPSLMDLGRPTPDGPLKYEDLTDSGPRMDGEGDVIEARYTEADKGGEDRDQTAREQAEKIVGEARAEAETLLEKAKRDVEELVRAGNERIEANKKEAFAKGYSGGEEAGFKKGYEDGFAKGKAQATGELQNGLIALDKARAELLGKKTDVLAEAQEDIVVMALAVAEKILHKEIMTDPKTVLGLVKNALSKVGFKKQFVIRVNPVDLETIQAGAKELTAVLEGHESLKVQGDSKIEPGGCVIQTESGIVDAQVDRQVADVKSQILGAMSKSGLS